MKIQGIKLDLPFTVRGSGFVIKKPNPQEESEKTNPQEESEKKEEDDKK